MTDGRFALNRRSLLIGGLAAGAVVALPAAGAAQAASSTASRALATDPFTLGVASGDPDDAGFVIWTRLALQPLAEDGLGGMPTRMITVNWEVAEDELFRRVVRRGTAPARPEAAHTVHVELGGLRPGRDYWYRFRAEGFVSPAGRTRTTPDLGTFGPALTMGFVSCSQFEHGFFTAYRRLAEENPDVILHLGDYQYEYTRNVFVAPGGNVRNHEGPETVSLATYRQRHAQYKTDADLQAAHAAAPWLVVWDDHEIENNWADEVPESGSETPDPAAFLARRAAAFQAFYENMPLRRTSIPRGIDMQLFRRIQWGRMATFHMLDTRQFRDDQACGDGFRNCPAALDPSRSITGPEQEEWLLDGFRRSDARWDIIGQQVFFAQRDNNAGPVKVTSQDAWDGYVASRQRITQGWVDAGVRNAVVLTGDVHNHWASDLKLDYDDPDSPTVGAELVASSITSGGDGADSDPATHPFLTINPHLRFFNGQRGYVLSRMEQGRMTTDFKTLPFVKTPGAEISTKATFVLEDRVPGLQQTFLRPLPPALAATQAAKSDEQIIRETVQQETERP